VLPVIAALKAHPDRLKVVPEHLHKYFDDHLLVSGWYPEQDYFALLQALVRTIDVKAVGGNVWRYFAKFSVQRDLGAPDPSAAPAGEGKGPGVYRNFASAIAQDPEQLFRRATRLWSQYHDSGTMQVSGGRASTNSVFVQLTGFHIPMEGFVRLQGHYLEEFGRLIGVELESRVTQSTARGDPICEWDYQLARTPASEAYVTSLPPAR
jgi:hypothetical protein